ncbi:MAG: competence/damage-inducible protein A [Clostridia bacterium]|nr:competence/damage-inducible protein A [Clostridia bacterium]
MDNIKTAEILSVGYELLLGDIVNTDAAFLCRRLASLGISVSRQHTVGDDSADLVDALHSALRRAPLVIMSGGLGPTFDDLTKETVAAAFCRKMYLDEPSLEKITRYFAARGTEMTQNNVKQAMMPEGAVIFENDYGTAPALAIEGNIDGVEGERIVIMLPGPPRELEPIFNERVMPYLAAKTGEIMVSSNINILGMGESAVEEILRELMQSSKNPTIAPYCGHGEVRLRVTARAENESKARGLCDEMIAKIKQTAVAPYIYDIDSPSIEDTAVRRLRERGMTVGCAESCTGGLVAKRLTDIAGCSDVFMGGCVTYSNESKIKLLGVDPDTLAKYGAVSEPVAAQMARGVRERLGTDVGISTTGIAGPGGGTPEKPVGTVWIAISTTEGEKTRLLRLSSMRERSYLRTLAANEAIAQIFNIK